MGMIENHKIWEVGAADLIPFARKMNHLTPAQVCVYVCTYVRTYVLYVRL